MAEITANSSLIQGSNRSGEAGCVLRDVREEEIVFRRVKTVMTINGVNGVNGANGVRAWTSRARFFNSFNPTSHVTNHEKAQWISSSRHNRN